VLQGAAVLDNKAQYPWSGSTSVGDPYEGRGGGIFFIDVALTVDSSEISGNESSVSGGGIARITTPGSSSLGVIIDNSTIQANKSAAGGGLYLSNATLLTISDNTLLSANEASGDGGAIWTPYENLANLSVVGHTVIFSHNKAQQGYWATDAADLALHDSTIDAASFTEPFTNAYNNYDIRYTSGDPYTPNDDSSGTSGQADGIPSTGDSTPAALLVLVVLAIAGVAVLAVRRRMPINRGRRD
jgi:LPXTG-motif cell wall-anchored protein